MIRHAYQLMMRLILAKHAAGELTDDELRDVLAECIATAREHGVLPDCFLTAGELAVMADGNNWELVRSFDLSSADAALSHVETLDPIQTEGFVVVDAHFNRVKIKSTRYVELHRMKGEATPRRAIELWQTGETDEVLAHFPEFAPKILPVQQTLEHAARCAWAEIRSASSIESRKEYAAIVKHRPWSAVCFRHFDDRALVTREAVTKSLRSQTLASLERLVEQIGVEP